MINVSLKTKAKEVDGNYVLDGITIGRVTDLKPNEWFGKVMRSNVGEEFAEYVEHFKYFISRLHGYKIHF